MFLLWETADIAGRSKGAIAGNIKRWHGRGPMSHGSHYHRGPGAMSGASSPSKVMKNKSYPAEWVTHESLYRILKWSADAEKLLMVGAVPGPRGNMLIIKETVKR